MTDVEFAKEIKNRELKGVYVLYGEEDYLKNYRAGEAVKLYREDEMSAFNLTELYCGEGECALDEIENALSAPAFMADSRLTVISFSDYDSLRERDKAALTSLLGAHSGDTDSACIVKLSGGGFDWGSEKKPSPSLKALSGVGKAVRFDYQSPSKLYSWLSKHAARYSLTLTPDAAELMLRLCGRSMYTLSGEAAKVCAHTASKGGGSVTAREVAICCSRVDEDDGFALANAICAGDADSAYRSLGIQKRLRADPYLLLGQVTRTFSDLAAASVYIADGKTAADLARDLKIHEYRAKLYFRSASGANVDYFRRALSLCLTADRNMKSLSTGWGELERLIGLASGR